MRGIKNQSGGPTSYLNVPQALLNLTESLCVAVREATRSKKDLGRRLPEYFCLFVVSPVRGPLKQSLMFALVLAHCVVLRESQCNVDGSCFVIKACVAIPHLTLHTVFVQDNLSPNTTQSTNTRANINDYGNKKSNGMSTQAISTYHKLILTLQNLS